MVILIAVLMELREVHSVKTEMSIKISDHLCVLTQELQQAVVVAVLMHSLLKIVLVIKSAAMVRVLLLCATVILIVGLMDLKEINFVRVEMCIKISKALCALTLEQRRVVAVIALTHN